MRTLRIDTRRLLLLRALQVSDLIAFSLAATAVTTGAVGRAAVLSATFSVWLLCSCLFLHVLFVGARVYASHRLQGRFPIARILAGLALATSASAVLAVFLALPLQLPMFVQIGGAATAMILASRIVLRLLLDWVRSRGRNLRFAVLVGSGDRATRLLKQLRAPTAGYCVLGYVDKRGDPGWAKRVALEYLGDIGQVKNVIAQQVVDEVFITLPVRSCYDDIAHVIRDCENQGVAVRLSLDFFRSYVSEQYVDVADANSVVSFLPSPGPHAYLAVKRAVDIAGSLLALVILAPVLLAVAVAIRIDTRGPVFFVQRRVGQNKRLFPLVKFRTMAPDSERRLAELSHLNEAHGPVFKIRSDPRVTRVGRVLRRASLDELPQLFNVLVGHMSLVGPRPLPLRDVSGFTVDWQRRRFSVKPGITCLWQVSGRSELNFDQWMELDMLYIDRRSLLLDLKIIARTVPAVLAQRGAY